ncbi:chloride channel CLIC-like protein 1 isoform X2 [Eriocheir sinensis]|uniref:chloride channel CLIC-like protein 1 isoform X2 n=1 Tax=Eriocheir sinensis TaxID=95602 RepID=UPI0021C7C95C|nr:chloride channel CLIC-like protein 1 isoform X2 [Eriocheir sinensis]
MRMKEKEHEGGGGDEERRRATIEKEEEQRRGGGRDEQRWEGGGGGGEGHRGAKEREGEELRREQAREREVEGGGGKGEQRRKEDEEIEGKRGGGGGGIHIGREEQRREGKKIKTGTIGTIWLLTLLILTIAMRVAAKHDPYDLDEDDDLATALHRLYQDSDGAMDPHNMLPGEKAYRQPSSSGGQGTEEGDDSQGYCRKEECKGEEKVTEELNGCLEHLNTMRNSLEEQIASLQLQKILAKEGILDLQAFYKRAVQHLWNTLRLEEGREVLKDGSSALMRQVMVRVTQDNLEGLDNYLKTESEPHKVDEFLQRGFTLQDLPSDAPRSLLHSLLMLGASVLQAGKSLELWLVVMCLGFLALGLWAVVLFVRDIQRELRWGRVLTMMATVVFFICCLWHWRHMYKMAESRRHAQLAKRGYAGIPEECQPGASTSTAANVYDWVKVNFFGSPDVCERYFEELMIDPSEEITPGMVIAETLSRFVFQPLQHLGTESAKLTTNFYKNVPVAYHLHATVLFLGLLIVVLFFGCAYGVDFPLGLGGFSPKTRPGAKTSAVGDGDGLGQEAVEQLKRDREKFLEESRRMLGDISREAVSWQGRQQPLVVASSSILEAQLEDLISQHLSRVMERSRPAVHTITSTPLRSEGHPAPSSQDSQEEPRVGTLADFSSSSEGSIDPSSTSTMAVMVSTDAVHRRMANTPPVKVLPPRTSRSSSRDSSINSSPAPSEVNSPSGRRKKPGKFQRKYRSTESPPRSPPPSPSASTQSLGGAGLDEPDHCAPGDSDSFLARVRNLLDSSANFGTPSPPRGAEGGYSNAQM